MDGSRLPPRGTRPKPGHKPPRPPALKLAKLRQQLRQAVNVEQRSVGCAFHGYDLSFDPRLGSRRTGPGAESRVLAITQYG